MNIKSIKSKVESKQPLNEHERNLLIDGVFNTYLKDDNPKYNKANQEWLNDMTDEILCKKYIEYSS